MVTVVINGLAREIEAGTTVAELLEREREPAGHVVVEVNGSYLPARDYDRRRLEDGDRVEIILPAFGG